MQLFFKIPDKTDKTRPKFQTTRHETPTPSQVDASGLEIGDHAVLCEDFDAVLGPLRPGPAAGPQVLLRCK